MPAVRAKAVMTRKARKTPSMSGRHSRPLRQFLLVAPEDLERARILSRDERIKAVRYWNGVIRDLKRKPHTK